MKRFGQKLLSCMGWLAAITLIAASLVGLYFWHFQGYKALSVQSGSMVPTFSKGDAVITQKAQPSELKPGSIVSYISPIDPGIVITHRLVSIDWNRGVAITKGDALPAPDPPVPLGQILGRMRVSVPKLGLAIDQLRQPAGLVIGVYLPALFVIIFEVRRLAKAYGWDHYRLAIKH